MGINQHNKTINYKKKILISLALNTMALQKFIK